MKTELWRPPFHKRQKPITEEKPSRKRCLRPASTRRSFSPLRRREARKLNCWTWLVQRRGGAGGFAGVARRRMRKTCTERLGAASVTFLRVLWKLPRS